MRATVLLVVAMCLSAGFAKGKDKDLNWQSGTLVNYQEVEDNCDKNGCQRRTTYVVDTGEMLYSFTRHGDRLNLTVNTSVKYSTDGKPNGKSWLLDEDGKIHEVTILEKRAKRP